MISLLRVVKFAIQNFWRNIWLSLITVSMLALTLLTVNILLVLNVVTDTAIAAVEDRVDVSVYFEADTTEETARNAAGFLRGLPQVRDVEVITPDEAIERFRQRHSADEAILSSLGELEVNPFGFTLVVRANSADDFPFILEALDHPQFRDQIRDKDFSDYALIIERLTRATGNLRKFGLALSSVFLLIGVLIIFNTVRITIFVHREEIAIMKLVGATNWFVRAPYILEALMYSALAVAVSAAAILPAASALEPAFDTYFGTVRTGLVGYFADNALLIFGSQFAGLALVSVLSTSFAMRRYLKV